MRPGSDPDSVCRRRDLNPHALEHSILSAACLPIPPLRRAAISLGVYGCNQTADGAERANVSYLPAKAYFPRLAPLKFGVWLWQLGQRNRRFPATLLWKSPSM